MICGRLGVVPYMNARPLWFGLRERLPEGSILEAVPSDLARMLRSGSIAAAVVSSAACFGGEGIRVMPEICIASDGPVQSVRLFFSTPVSGARRIGLDTASLSSAALAQIILREKFGLDPDFVPRSSADQELDVDGYLLIGDAAMIHPDAPLTIDLGKEWRDLTGLPFVYAVWGVSDGGDVEALYHVLLEAKRRGIENIRTIARSESERLCLDEDICLRYLTEVIHYDLGEREIAGLKLFAEKCQRHGLAPQGAAVEFVSP